MAKANPVFIPRNHLVEEAIEHASFKQDFGPFRALLARLDKPFDYEPGDRRLASPPQPEQQVTQTFCGT